MRLESCVAGGEHMDPAVNLIERLRKICGSEMFHMWGIRGDNGTIPGVPYGLESFLKKSGKGKSEGWDWL